MSKTANVSVFSIMCFKQKKGSIVKMDDIICYCMIIKKNWLGGAAILDHHIVS